MIKMRPYKTAINCSEDEIKTMIAGVIKEIEKGDTNWSVYIGGDTLVWGIKNDEGHLEVYDCLIRRTTLSDEDIGILAEPLPEPVNKGFPS